MTHPLDRPPLADRLAQLRILCGGLIAALLAVTAVVVSVVWFALDGQPIAGHMVRLAGLSAVTWAAVLVAAVAPVVGLAVAGRVVRTGRAARPTDPDRRLSVFAAGAFAEYAVAGGAGVLCALTYHLTADGVLLVAVGGLAGFLAARFPTADRVRRWYDAAGEAGADG